MSNLQTCFNKQIVNKLISTHMRSPNVCEVLYSIGYIYIDHTYLLFVYESIVSYRQISSLMISLFMIELWNSWIEKKNLVDRYPTHRTKFFLVKEYFFLVTLEQLGDCLEDIWSSNGNMLMGWWSHLYRVKSIHSKKRDLKSWEELPWKWLQKP